MLLRGEGPYLPKRFLEADTHLLLRRPRINGGHIGGFVRCKSGFRGSTLAEVLEVPSLVRLLDALEESGNRPMSQYRPLFLDRITAQGEPLVYCHYHADPRGKAAIEYTDALTRPLHFAARHTAPPQHREQEGAQELQRRRQQEEARPVIQVEPRQDKDRVRRLITGTATGARSKAPPQGIWSGSPTTTGDIGCAPPPNRRNPDLTQLMQNNRHP